VTTQYVAGSATDMRERAEALDLEVVDSIAFDAYARSFARVARRVAAARPEAVLLAAAAPPHADSFLRDLRAALGRDVALIAREGFEIIRGPAARGMYVGYYGIPNAELPPAGLQFLEELEASGAEPGPDLSAVYGAQAAEILLDAIARSDGTRASVTEELRATTVENGLLGDIRFDRYGDLVEGPVTIYRLTRKGAGGRPRDDGPRHLSLSRPGQPPFVPPLGSGAAPMGNGGTPRFPCHEAGVASAAWWSPGARADTAGILKRP
jgi:ABC-type branched-subunit amino acid transport system substrate-binding protein